jgi:hypothetical protein
MVSVARKLNTIEERRQVQSCLFRRRYYGNKGHNTEKTGMGSSPDEDVFCNSETKHNRRMAPRQNLFFSTRRLRELRSQTRELSCVLVPVKMSRDNSFLWYSTIRIEWSGLWTALGKYDWQKFPRSNTAGTLLVNIYREAACHQIRSENRTYWTATTRQATCELSTEWRGVAGRSACTETRDQQRYHHTCGIILRYKKSVFYIMPNICRRW